MIQLLPEHRKKGLGQTRWAASSLFPFEPSKCIEVGYTKIFGLALTWAKIIYHCV